MSTNCTFVQLVPSEAVAAVKLGYLVEDFLLERFQATEFAVGSNEGSKKVSNERADRTASFGRLDSRAAINVVADGDGDVLHSSTVSQFHGMRPATLPQIRPAVLASARKRSMPISVSGCFSI